MIESKIITTKAEREAYKKVIAQLRNREFHYAQLKRTLLAEIKKNDDKLLGAILAWEDFFNSATWKQYESHYYSILPRPKRNPKNIRRRGYLKKSEVIAFAKFIKGDWKYHYKKSAGVKTDKKYNDLVEKLTKERVKRLEYEDILRAYGLMPNE